MRPLPTRGRSRLVALVLAGALVACGRPSRVVLPQGLGRPATDAPAWLAEATARCGAVGSLTVEMMLSGRVEGRRARARVLAGTEATGRVRLEALAPFGAPLFVLAADGTGATLLLPREARVVRGASVEELLEALAGIRLGGADLHAALTGCGVARRDSASARAYGEDWRAIDLARGGTLWLARSGSATRVAAAALPGLAIEYGAATAGTRTVRLVAGVPGNEPRVDVSLALSQVEENVDLGPEAFGLVLPPDTTPMSIEELRQQGLLAREER
jgi:hypothetical protein